MKKLKTTILLVLLSVSLSFSQESVDTIEQVDLFDLTLEELMDIEVEVSSKKELKLKESPAILTVITKQEIQNSGARDLVDVLNLVPGITFNIDVQAVVGITIRGNWANEGKVLLLLDGQEINEDQFSTLQFGNHFSIDQIKKIEIIRGPGSSIYGGYAELSVINIITRDAEDLNGIYIGTEYGQLDKSFGHRNANLSFGKKINDFSISLQSFYSQSNSSTGIYTDLWGESYNLLDNRASKKDVVNGILKLKFKGLSSTLIYDNYMTNSVDMFDELVTPPQQVDFQSLLYELKYDIKIKDKLKITPKINYKSQKSWLSLDEYEYTNRLSNKYTANLTASYDITNQINLILGSEIYYTQAIVVDTTVEELYLYGNSDKIAFFNHAAFAQLLIKNKIANFTIGGRYDNHEEYQSAFSPRLGITKDFRRVYFKLLYNGAFRSPALENINLAPNFEISPEKTIVSEAELGYNFNNFSFAVNVFDIKIDNTIVYFYDEQNNEEGYRNVGKTGSTGFEAELKLKTSNIGYLTTNYSFYTAKFNNQVLDYQTNNESFMVANPQHKFTLFGSLRINKNIAFSPSFILLGERYGYTSVDEDDELILSKIKPTYLLNASLIYRNLFIENLNISLSFHDILNQRYTYYQPYNGYHAPYPGKGREITFKINYLLEL